MGIHIKKEKEGDYNHFAEKHSKQNHKWLSILQKHTPPLFSLMIPFIFFIVWHRKCSVIIKISYWYHHISKQVNKKQTELGICIRQTFILMSAGVIKYNKTKWQMTHKRKWTGSTKSFSVSRNLQIRLLAFSQSHYTSPSPLHALFFFPFIASRSVLPSHSHTLMI